MKRYSESNSTVLQDMDLVKRLSVYSDLSTTNKKSIKSYVNLQLPLNTNQFFLSFCEPYFCFKDFMVLLANHYLE